MDKIRLASNKLDLDDHEKNIQRSQMKRIRIARKINSALFDFDKEEIEDFVSEELPDEVASTMEAIRDIDQAIIKKIKVFSSYLESKDGSLNWKAKHPVGELQIRYNPISYALQVMLLDKRGKLLSGKDKNYSDSAQAAKQAPKDITSLITSILPRTKV